MEEMVGLMDVYMELVLICKGGTVDLASERETIAAAK